MERLYSFICGTYILRLLLGKSVNTTIPHIGRTLNCLACVVSVESENTPAICLHLLETKLTLVGSPYFLERLPNGVKLISSGSFSTPSTYQNAPSTGSNKYTLINLHNRKILTKNLIATRLVVPNSFFI